MPRGRAGGPAETPETDLDIDSFRVQLQRVRGVRAAYVTTEPGLAITLVAAGDRPDDEIVKDVKSLAAAAFGLLVGDREIKVSSDDALPVASSAGPPKLEWLNVAHDGQSARIDVGVSWQGIETTGGAIARSTSTESRALAAAQAVASALEPQLAEVRWKLTVGNVESVVVSNRDWIVVAVDFDDGETIRPLLGTAVLESDSVASGASALIDAVARIVA